MSKANRLCLSAALTLLLGISNHALAAEAKLPAKPNDAQALVTQALQAELDGRMAEREDLLQQAIKLDPNFAPARWQLGQVRVDDNWIGAADAASRPSAEREAYLRRRDALVDTADAHRELARWCKKHGLPEESRLHWTMLLEFEPQDSEALAALGLTWHDGQLLTRQQIADAQKAGAQRKQALRTWKAKVNQWRADLLSGEDDRVAKAREGLAQVDDPAALPALESMLLPKANDERSERLNLALISTIERMPTPEATELLLRTAMDTHSQAVCTACCAALKQRPLFTFVPQLIASWPDKLSSKFEIAIGADGTVVHEHQVKRDGLGGTQVLNLDATIHSTNLAMARLVAPRAVASEAANAAAIERDVQQAEILNTAIRERVKFVLNNTTGFESPDDPELLARQYEEYYGWSSSGEVKPVQTAHLSRNETYFPLPAQRDAPAPRMAARPTGDAASMRRLDPRTRWLGECFPAGTKVLTDRGEVAIESIRRGDRVLSQDLATGQLAYKTVQQRTLRQGVKMVTVNFGDQNLVATFGHPLWVVGRGWQVAGRLQAGDRLRGLTGEMKVASVERAPATEVYNLVVSDFATFFVGDQRLLAHDDTTPTAVPVALPGLAAVVR